MIDALIWLHVLLVCMQAAALIWVLKAHAYYPLPVVFVGLAINIGCLFVAIRSAT